MQRTAECEQIRKYVNTLCIAVRKSWKGTRLSVRLTQPNASCFSIRRRTGIDGYTFRWGKSKRSVLYSEDMELKELLEDLESTWDLWLLRPLYIS